MFFVSDARSKWVSIEEESKDSRSRLLQASLPKMTPLIQNGEIFAPIHF